MLLRAINMSGKLHMVPALINDDYVIRFAICAQNACEDDIRFAWNVISEMATEVIEACGTNHENEALKVIEKLESLDLTQEDEDDILESPTNAENPESGIEAETNEVDEVFLYDDNIPSIPSISTMYERKQRATNRRRNLLLRMISDPKCYNSRVLKSMCSDPKRHRSDNVGVKHGLSEDVCSNGTDV